MEVQTKLLDATVSLLSHVDSVSIGVLPASGGMVLHPAGGGTEDRYFSGSSRRRMTLQFLCKDSQQLAFDRLCRVCRFLDSLRSFPDMENVQMLPYESETEPQFTGLETPNGNTVYSVIVTLYYYLEGKTS